MLRKDKTCGVHGFSVCLPGVGKGNELLVDPSGFSGI
jgi:hypothetical protein